MCGHHPASARLGAVRHSPACFDLAVDARVDQQNVFSRRLLLTCRRTPDDQMDQIHRQQGIDITWAAPSKRTSASAARTWEGRQQSLHAGHQGAGGIKPEPAGLGDQFDQTTAPGGPRQTIHAPVRYLWASFCSSDAYWPRARCAATLLAISVRPKARARLAPAPRSSLFRLSEKAINRDQHTDQADRGQQPSDPGNHTVRTRTGTLHARQGKALTTVAPVPLLVVIIRHEYPQLASCRHPFRRCRKRER